MPPIPNWVLNLTLGAMVLLIAILIFVMCGGRVIETILVPE